MDEPKDKLTTPEAGHLRGLLPLIILGVIVLAALAPVFTAWYFVLPYIQKAVIPTAPGGTTGPWVVRPIAADHYVACAAFTAASMGFIMLVRAPFRKRRNAVGTAAGTGHVSFYRQPFAKTKVFIANFAMVVVLASMVTFYFRSWTVFEPGGIEVQSPWGYKKYSYDQIKSLETVPDGFRSGPTAGPSYTITLDHGLVINLSLRNEGCSKTDLSAIAAFIAEQSKRTWQLQDDVHED